MFLLFPGLALFLSRWRSTRSATGCATRSTRGAGKRPDALAQFAAIRLAGMLLVLLIVAFSTFVVFYLLPSDPARMACGRPCSPESLGWRGSSWASTSPWYQQFFDFLGGIFAGRTFGVGVDRDPLHRAVFRLRLPENVDVLS